MHNEEGQKQYYRLKNWSILIHFAITLLFLFIMAYSFSLPLKDAINVITRNSVIVVTIYLFLFFILYFIFTFGLKFYEGFVAERKFKSAVEPFGKWIKELAKKEGIIYCKFLVIVQIAYFFLETDQKFWWLWAWIAWMILSNLFTKIYPMFIQPLLYRYSLLDDSDLKQKLVSLAAKVNIKVKDIYKISSDWAIKKKEVALSWTGSERKVILSDTLSDYAKEEIEVITARELVHIHYGHLWQLLAVESVTALVGFCFVGVLVEPLIKIFGFKLIFDIAAFPVLAALFLIAIMIVVPIQNYFSRRLQRQTDEFVLKLTGSPEAFISVLMRQNLDQAKDPNPRRFIEVLLYEQPALSRRILMAQDYAHNLGFKKHPKF